MTRCSSRIDYILRKVLVLLWLVLACISLLHLLSIQLPYQLHNITVGYLAWLTIIVSIVVLGKNQLVKIASIFLVFFFFGFFTGSFLEPPADPLDHLRNTYERCEENTTDVKRLNRGLWQYGMNSVILCGGLRGTDSSDTYIFRADLLHGIYYGLGMIVLFLVARSAGFATRWAFMSIIVAMLFFGTNVFSYFRYYSFAPSYSSICIYWMWIAGFFFTRGWKNICFGLLAAMAALPILAVNHLQEAIFLLFLVAFWLLIFVSEVLISSSRKIKDKKSELGSIGLWRGKKVTLYLYILVVILIVFILPQSPAFRESLSTFFIRDYWMQNQDVVFMINDWHLTGRIWDFKYRIVGTLGLIGFLPLFLAPLFIVRYKDLNVSNNRVRILILGLLPFLIYCLPLFNFIWLSNCVRTPTHLRYYYRFCYAALAWLPIVYVVALLEFKVLQYKGLKSVSITVKKYSQIFILSTVTCLLVFVGTVRTFPFYGKIDFLKQESKPWWPQWSKAIDKLLAKGKGEVLTDPITGMVVAGVFGRPSVLSSKKMSEKILLIEEMDKICAVKHKGLFPAPLIVLLNNVPEESRNKLRQILIRYSSNVYESGQQGKVSGDSENKKNRHCLVNLQGFSPSWVPFVTGHWNPRITNTKLYYRYHYTSITNLVREVQADPPKNCIILY